MPVPEPRLRLVCFPYAGGGTQVFRGWREAIGPDVELWALALPGRGSRLHEKPLDRLSPIASASAEALRPLLRGPVAFFGHSFGALVAFEVARELRRRSQPGPVHLFASGARAPHYRHGEAIHQLPDDRFVERVRELNGTPTPVLESKELMELLVPVLRADFAAAETYRYAAEPPLGAAITAFGGRADSHVHRHELDDWYRHTRGRFSVRLFEGDHFFLHSAHEEVVESVSNELALIEATA